MISANKLKKSIFKITNQLQFEELCLTIFRMQYDLNAVYQEYCDYLGLKVSEVRTVDEIPFLPISFFKTHKVFVSNQKEKEVFTSSGTSSDLASKHYVYDLNLYQKSFTKAFSKFYGKKNNYCYLALLPSYLEREGSSLIYMVKNLIDSSDFANSGFYLDNYQELKNTILENQKNSIPTILIGVSFALVDFSEIFNGIGGNNLIVMETGGMKGRRKELTREELHKTLKQSFKVESIHSEYGMTELLSQAYSTDSGIFNCPPWMQVKVRKQDDPFDYCSNREIGGINVIDLANIHSCSFIQTDDLGRNYKDGSFEVIGRFDNSEIRGCNLMLA